MNKRRDDSEDAFLIGMALDRAPKDASQVRLRLETGPFGAGTVMPIGTPPDELIDQAIANLKAWTSSLEEHREGLAALLAESVSELQSQMN